jgi:membrane protein DedA with SNARE-associated domain
MTQLPENLPHIVQIAAPFVDKYGYFGVGGLLLLESMGVPFPGETTLIAAAIFAGIGQLNIYVVIIVGILAAIIGDNIAFAIGDFGGKRIIHKFGKYIFMPPDRYAKFEEFFNRNGGKVVIVARFIDGLRQLNGIIAGASDMKWLKFIIFNSIGAVIWVLTWTTVGYVGGSHIQTLLKYQAYASVIFILFIIGFIGWKVIKKKKETSK